MPMRELNAVGEVDNALQEGVARGDNLTRKLKGAN